MYTLSDLHPDLIAASRAAAPLAFQVDTRIEPLGLAQTETDPLLRTKTGAIHTEQTLTAAMLAVAYRTGAAEFITLLTVGAEGLRSALQDRMLGTDAE